MEKRTYYTAIGHFCRKTDELGRSYPVILVNHQEYPVDIQEMTLWAALSWRLLDFRQLQNKYDQLTASIEPPARRTIETCLNRLQTRGLVASGTGETDFDAIYDLLGSLYVVPLSESLSLRLLTFLKLTVLQGVPYARAKQLFQKDKPNQREAQVMELSRQALLSTAELIKCVEVGVSDISSDEKLLDALYSDLDTTSDNIGDMMRGARYQVPVTMAVANLYLRKQIILERV